MHIHMDLSFFEWPKTGTHHGYNEALLNKMEYHMVMHSVFHLNQMVNQTVNQMVNHSGNQYGYQLVSHMDHHETYIESHLIIIEARSSPTRTKNWRKGTIGPSVIRFLNEFCRTFQYISYGNGHKTCV